ncbi:MAG: toll/interleukin-1 receptor domain-containing protein [Blastocatellia bacterium]
MYEQHGLGAFIEKLREAWKKEFDFVLVDSRTGITDIGGICTVQLPDYLVLLFTANEQSLGGALSVVERARETRSGLPFDRAKLLVLPVATRLEVRVEYREAQKWLTTFEKRLGPLFADWSNKDVSASELLNHTRVPSIPYWSFGERLPVVEKGTKDPEDMGYAMETIAALVASKLANTDQLVKNRDSYVASARKGGSAALLEGRPKGLRRRTRAASVFISYSHRDSSYLKELLRHLASFTKIGLIEPWADAHISAGAKGRSELKEKLERADVILLLVSPNYLASKYARTVELPHAIQSSGQATVIPIILEGSSWFRSPIARFQVLPLGGKPISTWKEPDEAWDEVKRGIVAAIHQRGLRRRSK